MSFDTVAYANKLLARNSELCNQVKELEAENARLRQQRDAANAQLDFILENLKTTQVD